MVDHLTVITTACY